MPLLQLTPVTFRPTLPYRLPDIMHHQNGDCKYVRIKNAPIVAFIDSFSRNDWTFTQIFLQSDQTVAE